MRVHCSTCLELLTPGDDLSCTPCGHIFHMACVVQWFENKKNCPQCRNPANERNLRKIFLSDTDVPEDQKLDSDQLQSQLDNAKFQLRCKDGEMSKLNEKVKLLEEQSRGQKAECKELEKAKQRYKEQCEGYRTQAKVLQEERFKYEEARKERDQLKSKLETFKGVELSIRGQEADLNSFLHERGAFDSRTKDLATLVVMLKQKLAEVKKDRIRVETRMKEKEREEGVEKRKVRELGVELDEMRAIHRSLENSLRRSEEEKQEIRDDLQRQVAELEKKLVDKPTIESGVEYRIESPPLPDLPDDEDDEPIIPHSLPKIKAPVGQESLDDTLPLASSGILSTRRPLDQLQNLAVKPRLSSNQQQQYDGMGGSMSLMRAKLDTFPQPKKTGFLMDQNKKRKLGASLAPVKNKQMKTMDKFFGSFDTP